MTDKEFLESLDVVPMTDGRTVTIPLDMYNKLFEAYTDLQAIARTYSRSEVFNFKHICSIILGLEEEKADA